ncbi:MAG TPA: mechanosensitive ion channel domain-containing protein [Nitrospiria bacterium]|nr:mechanosensitive ion channel domain-containing protein [Nitrospiria bacterium]
MIGTKTSSKSPVLEVRRARFPREFQIIFLCLLSSITLATFPPPHAKAETQLTAPPNTEEKAKAPIVFDKKTLFFVRERVLSYSPEDRARTISDRINKLSKELVRTEPITVVNAETTSDITAGDLVIMTVTDQDAKGEGRPREQLAEEYAKQINVALEAHRKGYSIRSLLLGALFTLVASLILFIVLKLLIKILAKADAKINAWRSTRIPSLRIQSLEILPADRIADALIGLVKAARIAAIVILLYFYVPLVFSFFPWTRGFAGTLLDYILDPLAAVFHGAGVFLPNLFFIAVIVFVSRYVIMFVRLIFRGVERGTIALPGFYREWARPTYKIVRFLIIAFTAVIVFPYLPGSHSPAFRGISIFLGILFSLGSTSAVANVVAGVILTYMRGFSLGDRVRIADTVGDVIEATLLVTRVRTIKNVDVTIPNSMVLGSHIINYSSSARESGLILNTSVSIGYDAPWRQVHELLIAAARSTQHILDNPAPFVLQTGLNDFYATYELNAHTDKPRAMAVIYSELHQNIQDKFNEAGVEIMSPHYSALRDGNQDAIPREYFPKGYKPRAFRVSRTAEASEKPAKTFDQKSDLE